jgi:hypothetical protein
MFYSTIFSNPKNEGGGGQSSHYRLLLLGQDIPELDDAINNVVNIEYLFPLWIRERSNENSPSNHLVKFTQEYYNWLYSKSGYELSTVDFNPTGFQKLIDINETEVHFLEHFAKTYADGFPETFIETMTEDSEVTGNSVGLRRFITGIRQFFYQKKSNEEAYRYFFEMLYGDQVDDAGEPIDVDVNLYYPKVHMFRLNGGRFDGFPYMDPDGITGTYFSDPQDETDKPIRHLGGSYLNGPFKIQDSDWFQEYSYVLSTGVPLVDEETGQPIYTNLLKSILHPAGLKMFLEKTQEDYVPPNDYDGGFIVSETPVLGNYFPYRLNDYESIAHCIGCSGATGYHYDGPTAMRNLTTEAGLGGTHGWTYGNAWNDVGDGGITLGYHMPTYAYPNWSDGITGDVEQNIFGNIYIGEFIYLTPGNGSPNLGATGCTAYGNTDAGACWS